MAEKRLANIEFLNKTEIKQVFDIFSSHNPEPKTELHAPNDFTLLISVVLSAQATDKSVNAATKELYKVADTPEKIFALGEDGLKKYIKTIGLYNTKAKNIIALCKKLIEKFDSKVPKNREDLETLPGVGRKTSSVILNAVFGKSTMPVDTHVLRISARIGLSDGATPLLVEKDLLEKIPDRYMKNAHHHLVLHGRYVCKARKPDCNECIIEHICKKNGVTKK
ncbi:MAG: endonuclease III [Treponema sp.]|jgi:endonuclease-3|nr:endonuclease III [Treponema sp.]